MKKTLAIVLALMLLVLTLAACSPKEEETQTATDSTTTQTPAETKTYKIALVLGTGGLGDQGFNDITYSGVKRAEEELGVEISFVEPTDVSEFEGFHRDYADDGTYDLIIANGFDQKDAITLLSPEYPDQNWLLVDETCEGYDNIASFQFYDNEKMFLAGALAGQMTETNKLGLVGALPFPVIDRFLSGYIAGAKQVNPNIETSIAYVGDFVSATTAKEQSLAMYDADCDIVLAAAGGAGLGVLDAAETAGKWSIGVDNNVITNPDSTICMTYRESSNVIFDRIQAITEDNFVAGHTFYGLSDGYLKYTTEGTNIAIDPTYLETVETLKQAIIDGKIVVPQTLEEAEAFEPVVLD